MVRRKINPEVIRRANRSQEERKIRALYILLCLIFLAILSLLAIHAIIVGPGSFFWDMVVSLFAVFSAVVFASGVVFPLLALVLVLALPFVFLVIYLRNR